MRKFIKSTLAYNLSDWRDAVVIVAGGETGDAVFLGIDPHGAELINLELSAVLGKAHLLIDCGAAVIEMDRGGGDEHDRREKNQRHARGRDVKDALEDGVFRVELGPGNKKDRGVKGLDMPRLLHDNITDVREEETGDPLFLAVLGDAVAAAGMDPRHEDCLVALQAVPDGLEAVAVVLEFFHDLIKPLGRLALDAAEALLVQFIAIDENGLLRGVELKIVPIGEIRPDGIQNQLQDQEDEEDQRVVPVLPGEAHNKPHDTGTEELGQELGEDQTPDSRIPQEIGVIRPVEEGHADGISGENIIVIAEAILVHAGEPAVMEIQPGDIEHGKRQPEMHQFEAHQTELFPVLFFSLQVIQKKSTSFIRAVSPPRGIARHSATFLL